MLIPAGLRHRERVIRTNGRLVIVAHARRVRGRCPTCGTTSSAVHSRFERRPADLPSIGQPMTLHLRVRRFYCHHRACRRHTFAETRTCGVAALETFAVDLTQDRPAVRAALTTSWSNAQAEGQISRLKMLKRTMYGRASFALRRRRVLLAA